MKHKISVIISNFNGVNHLKKCIPTILRQTYSNIEIIMVDNNSIDDTVIFLKTKYPKVILIQNKKDFGFAKANNIGVRRATGEFIFILNNDTELFPDTIEQLFKSYQNKSILTSFQIPILNKKLPGRSGAGADIFGYPYSEANPLKTKIFYADGAAIFMKKIDFINIGMFDEKLYMFQEDIDLSWRARIFDYKIIPVPESRLYHYFGGTEHIKVDKKKYQSTYFRRYLNERNVLRNMLKNYEVSTLFILLPVLLIIHIGENLIFLLTGRWRVISCYIQSYIWNLNNLNNTLKMRKKIQKNRTVSDAEIFKHMYLTYSKINMILRLKTIPEFS